MSPKQIEKREKEMGLFYKLSFLRKVFYLKRFHTAKSAVRQCRESDVKARILGLIAAPVGKYLLIFVALRGVSFCNRTAA